MPDLATLPQPPSSAPPALTDVLLIGRPPAVGSPPGSVMIPYAIPISDLPTTGGVTYTGQAPVTVTGTVIGVSVGTGAGTVAAGNDARFTAPVTTISASGTAQTLAFPASGNAAYDITKTGNVALTLTGGTAGQYQTLTVVVRPGAGGFTETLPAGVKWPGGTAPTPSTSSINVYYLSTPDAGVTIIGNY